jgi:hypothetical protein
VISAIGYAPVFLSVYRKYPLMLGFLVPIVMDESTMEDALFVTIAHLIPPIAIARNPSRCNWKKGSSSFHVSIMT